MIPGVFPFFVSIAVVVGAVALVALVLAVMFG
jgi:hypothetical protein